MFGSHLSIAGSMVNALTEAERLGLDTVQVFTKNQQQWKAKPLDPAIVREWRAQIARLRWQDRTVSHASYLINLASVKDDLWNQSVDLMTDEIQRCESLGIPFLVHHPGSHVGAQLHDGMRRLEDAWAEIFRRTRGFRTVTCFEGTAGAGSTIGGPFEHLAELRSRVVARTGEDARAGFCLDTCHLHAAGHDMSSAAAAHATLQRFDELCGLRFVRVWHLNDSKGKLASRLDRHTHIGEGEVGGGAPGRHSAARLARSGFAVVVNHPLFAGVPKIMETPKDDPPPSGPWDAINLQRLKSLLTRAAPTAPTRTPTRTPAGKSRGPAPVRTRKRA